MFHTVLFQTSTQGVGQSKDPQYYTLHCVKFKLVKLLSGSIYTGTSEQCCVWGPSHGTAM